MNYFPTYRKIFHQGERVPQGACQALYSMSKSTLLQADPVVECSLNVDDFGFIMSDFNYCPLVWHFCGQVNNQKLEKIQERALRILFADYNSSYMELLGRAGTTTLLIQRLRRIALTVFKSVHGLNPPCLNDMFTPKELPYRMRDSSLLEQSGCRTTAFGLRSISYIGAKLWND